MKKFMAILAVAVAASVVFAGSAQAGCQTVGCFNHKISKLTKKVGGLTRHLAADEKVINANTGVFNGFTGCLRRVPVSSFDGFAYDFDGDGFYDPANVDDGISTALDYDTSGSPDVYLLRYSCPGIPVGRVASRVQVR